MPAMNTTDQKQVQIVAIDVAHFRKYGNRTHLQAQAEAAMLLIRQEIRRHPELAKCDPGKLDLVTAVKLILDRLPRARSCIGISLNDVSSRVFLMLIRLEFLRDVDQHCVLEVPASLNAKLIAEYLLFLLDAEENERKDPADHSVPVVGRSGLVQLQDRLDRRERRTAREIANLKRLAGCD